MFKYYLGIKVGFSVKYGSFIFEGLWEIEDLLTSQELAVGFFAGFLSAAYRLKYGTNFDKEDYLESMYEHDTV